MQRLHALTSITYTATLDLGRETAETPARLLREHRERLGTRKGTRALGVFKQGVLVLRWFVDGTRLTQLARDNRVSVPTAYRYLHHGGKVQVISAPDGWPIWVSPVRPGREHDTTCARTHGLVDALNRLASTLDILTLTDRGYENADDGFRHPVKKPKGGEPDDAQQTFNSVIRGVHAVAERANALLKVTFKALRRVSLDLRGITRIARAALVLLHLEHGRTT